MRALVVDDQFVSRRILQQYLQGYAETEAVSSGEQALEAISFALDNAVPFDLVCLDVEMPGIDGHETLRRLRALEAQHGRHGLSTTKVFMVTAQNNPRSVFAAFRDQCEAYLVKPVDRNALERELINAMLIPRP
ncbi:MAG TPA: response regulator [Planctomycetes bacterium]|nr:response regulator [Planctomycetota bacterium]